MKKILCVLLAAMLMAGGMYSCGKDDAVEDWYDYSEEELQAELESKFDELFGEENPEDAETEACVDTGTETEPGLFDLQFYIDQYDIFDITPFYNGVARFELGYGETFSYSTEEEDFKDGKYGYVDTEGNVLVLPMYTDLPEKYELPVIGTCMVKKWSESEYMEDIRVLCDAEKPFAEQVGENMEAFSAVENGYFWIHTKEVKLSGDISTMYYYTADGEEAFAAENAEPVGYSQYGDGDSGFAGNGYALVSIDGYGTLIDTSGNVVKLQYTGTKYENVETLHIEKRCGNILMACIKYDSNGFLRENRCFFIMDPEGLTYRETENTYDFDVLQEMDGKILDNKQGILYSADGQTILVDFKSLPAFEGVIACKGWASADERIIVLLAREDWTQFYAICDMDGNVLMEPVNDIVLATKWLDRSEKVYAACDSDTGLYGTVSETGEWIIKPQYYSLTVYEEGWTVAQQGQIGDKDCRFYYYDAEGNLLFTYHPGTAW